MIAYYRSDERLMDFDVYQFPKDEMSLEEYAAKESEEYGADDFDMLSINDIELARYYSEEEYDGKSYRVVNSEDVNEVEGGLFITKDGVECRSIKIGNMGSFFTFGEELYNETGEDKTFDPTGFVLETESGELIFPCLISRDANEVRAETKRLWMSYTIYDPKDIEGGSEVSVYYDGVFITKVTVEEK